MQKRLTNLQLTQANGHDDLSGRIGEKVKSKLTRGNSKAVSPACKFQLIRDAATEGSVQWMGWFVLVPSSCLQIIMIRFYELHIQFIDIIIRTAIYLNRWYLKDFCLFWFRFQFINGFLKIDATATPLIMGFTMWNILFSFIIFNYMYKF